MNSTCNCASPLNSLYLKPISIKKLKLTLSQLLEFKSENCMTKVSSKALSTFQDLFPYQGNETKDLIFIVIISNSIYMERFDTLLLS